MAARLKGQQQHETLTTAAMRRLATRDDVCVNCGRDAVGSVDELLHCARKRCEGVVKKLAADRRARPKPAGRDNWRTGNGYD